MPIFWGGREVLPVQGGGGTVRVGLIGAGWGWDFGSLQYAVPLSITSDIKLLFEDIVSFVF